jgi:hypothetical protein
MEEAPETPSASLREYTIPLWDDRPAKPPFISLGYKVEGISKAWVLRVIKSRLVGDSLLQPLFVLCFIACAVPTPRFLQTTQSHVFNRFKSQLL